MIAHRWSWQAISAFLLALVGAFFEAGSVQGSVGVWPAIGLVAVAALVSAFLAVRPYGEALLTFIGAHGAAWLLLAGVTGHEGNAGTSFYLVLAGAWLLAWRCATVLSAIKPSGRGESVALGLIIPVIFGAWILILWEAVVRGAGIPFVLLPPPSAIAARIATSAEVLTMDVRQTVFKAVIAGYVMGCGAGFVAAIAADRFVFLRRGLLPIGNMAAALPIIGVAPIMVMWFGFDWQSKAAVVVIMTFFPMLVNAVTGLQAAGALERDLMRSYGASYLDTLLKLRLPAAMPFVFNALKINSTLALIGAIVAEFFGTPIVGMGFRISTEVGRLGLDMVWAEIAVAAIAGSAFYGVIALVERAVTFWHPSYRSRKDQ